MSTQGERGRGGLGASLALAALACLGPCTALRADDRGAARFDGEILAPPLVEAGEAFEATIVLHGDGGLVPLSRGTRVRYGDVDLRVGRDGEVTVPPIEEEGNHFLPDEVVLLSESGALRLRPRHVEVVRVADDLPTRLMHTSRILRPGGQVTLLGQRLDRLAGRGRLEGEGGRAVDLGPLVFRSSIAMAWSLPVDLPAGTWRLVAVDAAGRRHAAPDPTPSPHVEVWGPPVRTLEHPGVFYVRSDTDVTATLGGLPAVRPHVSRLELIARKTETVHYTPMRLGPFHVDVRVESALDDLPPPGAPGVATEWVPPEVRRDERADTTRVRAPTRLVDPVGRPMAGRPVGVLLSHPGGLEFRRLTTDVHGYATFEATLPGDVAAHEVAAHLWAARETTWVKQSNDGGGAARKPPAPCEELLVVFEYDPDEGDDTEDVARNVDLKASAEARAAALKAGKPPEKATIVVVDKKGSLEKALGGKQYDSIEVFGHGSKDGALKLPYAAKGEGATKPGHVLPPPPPVEDNPHAGLPAGDQDNLDAFLKTLEKGLRSREGCSPQVHLHTCYSDRLAEAVAKGCGVATTGYTLRVLFPYTEDEDKTNKEYSPPVPDKEQGSQVKKHDPPQKEAPKKTDPKKGAPPKKK